MHYSKYPMLLLILTVFTSLNSASLNAGAIHKWVDEKGNVNYSDSPPAKTSSDNIRVQSAPSNPGKALPRLKTSASDQVTGSAGKEQKVSAEQASKICASAQADLDVISTSDRIKLQEADGNIRYLSDEEIAERQTSSQVEVDRFCN